MLDQIEDTIKNLPSISFEEFYSAYVSDIEEYILSEEMHRVAAQIYTSKNVAKVERSIELLIKGVKEIS